MDHAIAFATAGSLRRAAAVVAATVLVTTAVGSAVVAQTLTDPNPQTRWSSPGAAVKSPPAAHVKSCGAYGPGFVAVAGTDACVKIGDYVSTDVSSGRGR